MFNSAKKYCQEQLDYQRLFILLRKLAYILSIRAIAIDAQMDGDRLWHHSHIIRAEQPQ
ncbi:MAG: hypothetical protein RBJ76_21335 [Stenomitos frigidus ULC029]